MKRWSVAVRGVKTGEVYPLTFLSFRRRRAAERYADRLNRRYGDDPLVEAIVLRDE